MADAQAAVQAVLDDLVRRDAERGVQVAAYFDGERVVDSWAGVADPETGRAVNGETLFTVFSSTKGVAATVIHLLAERGILDYDDPIADYWPEFAAHGKERITIRQALTHTAGIPHMPANVNMCNWDEVCRGIADLTPIWEPGTQMGYHSLTFGWILGETARRADGRPIEQIVAEDICQPLDITSLFFGIPDAVEPRVAPLEHGPTIAAAPSLWNRPEVRRAVIPAGGGIMNARALAQHYAALVGDGVNGVRLLPPERVRVASALEVEGQDSELKVAIRRGLGYMLGGPVMPMGNRVTAFGHRGYGGSVGFADPECRFAFALTKNRLAISAPGTSTADTVANTIRAALGIPNGSAT